MKHTLDTELLYSRLLEIEQELENLILEEDAIRKENTRKTWFGFGPTICDYPIDRLWKLQKDLDTIQKAYIEIIGVSFTNQTRVGTTELCSEKDEILLEYL
jgi:hypothetical protein